MDQQKKHNIKLGIFILVGLLFFGIGILAIGNINKSFTKTITVYSVFDEVSGLQPGDNIWFSGVKVGTVKAMQFVDDASVEVTMKIETKSKTYIPNNAKTKISSDGLIGNKIIVIYGGSTKNGHLETGDTLAFERTYSTEDMITMLQENNKNLLAITGDFRKISGEIAAGEGSLGKLISEDTLYQSVNRVVANLNKASAKTIQLTAAINTFADKLNQEGNLMNDLAEDTTIYNSISGSVKQLNDFTAAAVQSANNLQITTSELNKNTDTPVGVLLHNEQVAENIKTTVQQLESSTAKLNASLDALQHSIFLRHYFKKHKTETDTIH